MRVYIYVLTFNQLKGATSDDDVCSIAMDCCDDILTCGFNKPLAKLKIGDVDRLIQSVALHSTILRIKSEIDQFTEGLHEAGVLHAIKEYPHLFYPMFVKSDSAVVDAGYQHVSHQNTCYNHAPLSFRFYNQPVQAESFLRPW